MNKLEHLKMLVEYDFYGACIWAEKNIKGLDDYFETWADNCGASREVFVGHTVRMLINLEWNE